MNRDDLVSTVARLEAVAERFEGIAKDVGDHAQRIASLEQSRSSWRTAGKFVGSIVGSLVVGVVLFYLVGRGK